MADFLAGFRDVGRLALPESFKEPLIALADIVTRARSGVARDYYARPPLHARSRRRRHGWRSSSPSWGLRCSRSASTSGGLAARSQNGLGLGPGRALRRPQLLSRHDDAIQPATIQEETGLPERTAARVAEDVAVLMLATHRKEKNVWVVSQSEIAQKYWDGDE